MQKTKAAQKKWKLIGKYPIKKYTCGLVAGQKVRLRKNLIVRDHTGKPTSERKAGEIWEVLSGSAEPPVVVWFRRPDGDPHTWDDNKSIYEYFEVVQD